METPDFLHKISNNYHEHEITDMFHFYQLKEVLKVFTEFSNKVQITCLEKYMFDSSLDSFFFFDLIQEFQTRSFCDTEKVIESFI